MVFALGEIALIWEFNNLPINYDFPELTGPISPTLREKALGGLFHWLLYLLTKTKSPCYVSESSGISYRGVIYRTGLPLLISGALSFKSLGYCAGNTFYYVIYFSPYLTLKKCFFLPW